jgi:hypothetical protein
MPHDPTPDIIVGALDLFDLLPAELARVLSTDELTGSFVGDAGGIAWQNNRAFVCFKPPGSQRNMLQELVLSPSARLVPIGTTPGYFKDGGCAICFGPGGEVWVLNTCSPDPTTGSIARPVLWRTGIFCGADWAQGSDGATGRAGSARPARRGRGRHTGTAEYARGGAQREDRRPRQATQEYGDRRRRAMTYTATRRAAIRKEPRLLAAYDAWVWPGQCLEGRRVPGGWIEAMRDGEIVGYIRARAVRIVSTR